MLGKVLGLLAGSAMLLSLAGAAQAAEAKIPKAGEDGWVSLFDGTQKDLEARWRPSNEKRNRWKAVEGELHNTENGAANLQSDVKLMDHELFIQFKVPRGGNSGVYLQGRYEVQVGDTFGRKEPGKGDCGAVYGKIAPKVNAALEVKGEETDWQTFRITFHSAREADGKVAKKARITVVHNGKPIIEDAEIDGLTGGAVDNKEGTPGGLMLQGDHTKVKYRNILYRPIKAAE